MVLGDSQVWRDGLRVDSWSPLARGHPAGLQGEVSAEGIAHFSPRGVCDRLVKKQTAGAGAGRQGGMAESSAAVWRL